MTGTSGAKAIAIFSCVVLLHGWAVTVRAQEAVRRVTFYSPRINGRNAEVVGGGQNRYLSDAEWYAYALDEDGDGGVDSVHMQILDPVEGFWSFEFSSALGSRLQVGAYDGAQTYPFADPCEPSLYITGAGRACDHVFGTFEVLDAAFDPNVPAGSPVRVLRFAVRFEQNCGIPGYPLQGSLYFDSPVVATGPKPVVKSVEYTAGRRPYSSVLTVTGTNCGKASCLVIDGRTSVIPLIRGNALGDSGTFRNARFPVLSRGMHVVQIANDDGALSAPVEFRAS